jgi:hypothetical protein
VRVLFTNNTLAGWAGTEVWVRDMALELLARGHAPVAYSRHLGAVARELREATVPVVDDLDRLAEPPDLIHGHHHLETMTALLRFPGVPAVAFCHGWLPAEEAVPAFPRIRRYLASDDLTRERLVAEAGIPPEQVVVLRNFVDLDRFRPRPPLPPRPARALVLSNQASEDTHLPVVRSACRAAGLEVEVVGLAAGTVTPHPEHALAAADVVFAKGKAALEAAAVGAAVILCDEHGLGPLVTSDDLDRQRALNFGVRLLAEPLAEEGIARRLAAYDPEDAARVRDRLRAEAGLDRAADRLLEIYAAVLHEEAERPPAGLADELAAAARYLRWGPLRGGDLWVPEREELLARVERAEGAAEALRGALEDARAERLARDDRALAASDAELERERARQTAEGEALRARVAEVELERAQQAAEGEALRARVAELERAQQAAEGEALRARVAELERAQQAAEGEALRARVAELERALAAVRDEREWIHGTATWRLRERLVRIRPLVAAYRWLGGGRHGRS